MNVLIVVVATVALLFALAFFTKRRFGVLGLALAVGFVLSGLWTEPAIPLVAEAGLRIIAPPLGTIVATVLILAPAVLLLFSGPKYTAMPQRVIGAAAFAFLALAFMVEPLGSALVLEGDGKKYFDLLVANRDYIVTAGLIFALFDILTIKKPKPEKH